MDIKLRHVDEESLADALDLACTFASEFPERLGLTNGVAYRRWDKSQYYVHRTKAGMIVVTAQTTKGG